MTTLAPEVEYFPVLTDDNYLISLKPIQRASAWNKLRLEVVASHPYCICCKSKTLLAVHHLKPFHLYPELELDKENLYVVCSRCHFTYAHYLDWRAWNSSFVALALRVQNKIYVRQD